MQVESKSRLMKLGLAGVAAAASMALPVVANAESYTVQAGDTLSIIASKYKTSVDAIASENAITNVNFISIGQLLTIGASQPSEASAEVATETAVDSTVENSTPSTEETSSDGSVSNTTGAYTATYSAADYAAKEEIAQRESGGSYTATNGQYYGRYQLTLSYLNGDTSSENQERVADSYVASRYGSWSAALAFWNANGWY